MNDLKKGEATEEILREYFLELDYYVIRSLRFTYSSYDVTDIDLMLYSKSSPFTRERTNVDIKRRKTPQAIERIFWTKGLRDTLGFDKCIVATTDLRSEVSEFGNANKVTVLDGSFISRIAERSKKKNSKRISEEELLAQLESISVGDLYSNWKKIYEDSKSLLLKQLNFNICNQMLKVIHEMFEFYIVTENKEIITRALYAIVSHFLIALDFSIRGLILLDEEKRQQNLSNLFRYGETGLNRSKEIIRLLEPVLHNIDPSVKLHERNITDALDIQFKDINAEILSEFFAKQQNASRLIENAKKYESYAFTIEINSISNLSTEEKSIIAILCDYYKIDRKRVL